jgi:hypothetical protein
MYGHCGKDVIDTLIDEAPYLSGTPGRHKQMLKDFIYYVPSSGLRTLS